MLTLAAAGILFAWCYLRSADIAWIAAAYSMYIMVYGILSYVSFFHALALPGKSTFSLLARLLMPFLILALVCLVLTTKRTMLFSFLESEALKIFWSIFIITVVSVPFIWRLNKKFSVIKEVSSMIRSKIGNVGERKVMNEKVA